YAGTRFRLRRYGIAGSRVEGAQARTSFSTVRRLRVVSRGATAFPARTLANGVSSVDPLGTRQYTTPSPSATDSTSSGRPSAASRMAAEGLPLEVESVAEGDGVVYWRVPKGSTLETPFAKVLAGKAVAPLLTTRNLRTVEKLVRA